MPWIAFKIGMKHQNHVNGNEWQTVKWNVWVSNRLVSPWPQSHSYSPTLQGWKKSMSMFLKLWNQITGSISNCYKKHIINFQYFTLLDYSATAVSIVLLRYSRFPPVLCPFFFNNWMSPSLSLKSMLVLFDTIYEDVRSHFCFLFTFSYFFCILFDLYLFQCFKITKSCVGAQDPCSKIQYF